MDLAQFNMLLPAFALVLARMTGVVLAVPMLASAQLPRMVKVLLVAALSLMVFPVVGPRLPSQLTLSHAALGMAGEFLIGELLGLTASLVLYAAQMAGKVVSHQSGFSLGEVFNPLFEEEFTVLDQLWFFAAFMFFLALRGHVAVVELILKSFDQVPPLALVNLDGIGEYVIAAATTLFDVAMRLSGPAIVALLLTSLVMGFLTKTMPQLNILSVGFSVKIGAALVLMGMTIACSEGLMTRTLWDGMDDLGRLLENLAGK